MAGRRWPSYKRGLGRDDDVGLVERYIQKVKSRAGVVQKSDKLVRCGDPKEVQLSRKKCGKESSPPLVV